MTAGSFLRRAILAACTCTIVACGDSTAPNANLSEEDLAELLDALSAVGGFSAGDGIAAARAPSNAAVANAYGSVSQTLSCPNGGTVSLSGSFNENEATGFATMQVNQDYNACKGTSSSGRVWTFDGDPHITMNLTMTVNQTTGAFTMSGTQKGGIRFSAEGISGRCSIDIAISMSSTGEGAVTGSITGEVCGKPVSESVAE